MAKNDQRDWRWSEALHMLARAERMHQQVFQPRAASRPRPTWEPPVDVLETKDAVIVIAGVPGVDAESAQAVIESGALHISGERRLPDELRSAEIHRMELPQGRFERRIPLPPGRYAAIARFEVHGCLVFKLTTVAA